MESKLVVKTDLENIVKESLEKGVKWTDLLLSEKKISEVDLKRMEAFVLGIPFVNLAKEKSTQRFCRLYLNLLRTIIILLLITKGECARSCNARRR